MTSLHFAHVIVLGLWGGCVLVEILLELKALKNQELHKAIPQLHYAIDIYIETPLLILVLLTGILLFDSQKANPSYLIKVACGLIAVTANFVCILFVVLRKKADDAGNSGSIEKYTRLVFSTVFIGVPAGVIALYLGISFLGYF